MAKLNHCRQIDVRLDGCSYPVFITSSRLKENGLINGLVQSRQLLIVTNETIAPLYLDGLMNQFTDRQCDVVLLKDGEQYKNQESLNLIYDALITKRHHRDTHLIALGGGVIGDITGFAASTYQRGVSFIQIPTTLLAQVDASVGGKTAINHPLGKNLIGSFYQPKAVFIDIETLATLPARELNAGVAEMIKYGLLEGGSFLTDLSALLQQGLTANRQEELMDLISACCKIKAHVVQRDEKEQGERALLNLGHTFAHALEALTNYQRWLHGEAVAIGLYVAALLSWQLGYLQRKHLNELQTMLKNANLPHKIPKDINLTKLREKLSLDKKVKADKLQFVLIQVPGHCFLSADITEKQLIQALMDAVEGE